MTVAQRFAREGVSITLLDLELELPMLELSATKQIAMRNCVNRATNECAFDVAYIYNTNYGYVYNELILIFFFFYNFPPTAPSGIRLNGRGMLQFVAFCPQKATSSCAQVVLIKTLTLPRG